MKNISLALNVVLLIAVGVLYYLQFAKGESRSANMPSTAQQLGVAYINSDTVLKYYDYFKVNRDRLEAKGKKLDQDLKSRAQALQNEFESYQRNASSLTIGQARAVEEDLTKKRQNLELYQQSLNQEMMVDQQKMTTDLYDRVTSYLKKYGQQQGLQIVLKYDASSDLLFSNDSLDISKVVIAGLNQDYQAEQTKAAAADTTKAKKKK